MANSKNIRLVSGGFDPVHSGHIDLLKAAKADLGDHIHTIVALNSDDWLVRKKGSYFLTWKERAAIINNMKDVQQVIKFNDDDGTACDAIEILKAKWPDYTIHFYNGGDRDEGNIMEIMKYAGDPLVEFHFGAGGTEKQTSSSEILLDWLGRHQQVTERPWGAYNVLSEINYSKVKNIRVEPGKSLSMQKHEHRSEHWFVAWGTATVEYQPNLESEIITQELGRHSIITIPVGCWHKLHNNSTDKLLLVEIQYGAECEEFDIIRQDR